MSSSASSSCCALGTLLLGAVLSFLSDIDCQVSNIVDGRSLARIQPGIGLQQQQLALNDVTSLFYNEEYNEIYTGNKDGHLHVWSN